MHVHKNTRNLANRYRYFKVSTEEVKSMTFVFNTSLGGKSLTI